MAYDEDLAERIRAIVYASTGVTEKKMFGGLAFLIGGNLAVAASGQGGLMLRVDPADATQLLTDPVASPVEMRGRPMTGWLRVDTDRLSESAFAHWVGRGVGYASSLPAKGR